MAIGLATAAAAFVFSAAHHAGLGESSIRAFLAFGVGFFWRSVVAAALLIGIVYAALRLTGVIPDWLPHSGAR